MSFRERSMGVSSEYRDKSLREIISSIVEEELEKYPKKNVTRDDLIKINAKHSRQRRKKFIKIAGFAALFIFAVILTGALMFATDGFVNVDADKNPKEKTVTEDGVVVEDGGYNSKSSDKLIITEWDEIENEYRLYLGGILIPKYVPDGYEFKELTAENTTETQTYIYIFENKQSKVFELHQYIHTDTLNSIKVEDRENALKCESGTIYLQEIGEINKATIQINGGMIIDVWGDFTDEEFIKIIDNLNPLYS